MRRSLSHTPFELGRRMPRSPSDAGNSFLTEQRECFARLQLPGRKGPELRSSRKAQVGSQYAAIEHSIVEHPTASGGASESLPRLSSPGGKGYKRCAS